MILHHFCAMYVSFLAWSGVLVCDVKELQDVKTSLEICQRDNFLYSQWTWQKRSSRSEIQSLLSFGQDCVLLLTAHSSHHSTWLPNVEIHSHKKKTPKEHFQIVPRGQSDLRQVTFEKTAVLLTSSLGPQSENLDIFGSNSSDFMMFSLSHI